MAAERALEPSPLGLIRAFELLRPSGSVHQVLVWVEDAEIVMKDGAALSHPRQGLTHTALSDITGIDLMTDPDGVILVMRTERAQYLLRGSTAVVDGFVEELRQLGASPAPLRRESSVRRLHRWLNRVLGFAVPGS